MSLELISLESRETFLSLLAEETGHSGQRSHSVSEPFWPCLPVTTASIFVPAALAGPSADVLSSCLVALCQVPGSQFLSALPLLSLELRVLCY